MYLVPFVPKIIMIPLLHSHHTLHSNFVSAHKRRHVQTYSHTLKPCNMAIRYRSILKTSR
ncbi:hypothetical protein Hanom_Chr08g00682941 [Helianthus anomalus]